MTLHAGDFFDHYQICAHVAQGGIGDVYRAQDTLTGRTVALKIPTRSTVLNPPLYDQFLREVEAIRGLEHPAVQRGIESGRFEDTPFLVSEWIEGDSLRRLLKETGSFPLERALRLTRRIADGLDYCHRQGVVHRDLKPDNLLIRNDDQPVILDFGLALSKARPTTGKAAGTPDYMAPEQIEGQTGDQRIDIYALGTILYELLAGTLPFTGADVEEVMNKHLYAAVPRLDRARPDVSAQLTTVVAKCLQRDPDRRYSDVNDLLDDLDHLNQVDTSCLDALTAAPPGPPFFRTQAGQVILILSAFLVVTVFLTVAAVALKH